MAVSVPTAPAFSLRGIVKSFGGRRVLDGLDLEVGPRARVGLVGANGAGKSTILRLLAGDDAPDAGALTIRRGATVAFLPQLVGGDDRTALQTVRAAVPAAVAVHEELASVEAALADPALAEDLDRMTRLLARQAGLVDALAEQTVDGDAIRLLRELGLDDADVDRPTRTLSGGERKLVALAACLVRRPDLLLLDEPEAHLDMARRSLLESLVQELDGAVVVVSHDRFLLDEIVDQVAELEHGRVRMWQGGYSAYTVARELELVRRQQAYVTQQKEIARLETAIRRFKDWAHRVVDERHIKQARNKQRQIDRMEKIQRPVFERRRMALALRAAARGGERVVELRDVEFDPELTGVDLTVMRGERIGIVGPNGAGKTVLLKLLAGELAASSGQRWAGPSIAFDHLTQAVAELPDEATALDVVRATGRMTEEEAVRKLMGFLFDYEQVRRPVAAMSGGERTRLRCLTLMLGGANCLLLDEPTNHLDIESVEVLEHALEAFDGTVIAVSHDRYFLDRIADRIVEVRDLEVRSYEGGYSDWSERAVRERGTSF
ncbi:MAG TPA: ABC-F family ATP-binding cassette domain-containing protein [Baekduia sp.]|uniref:ribosomal protection-like ABC-F family protein n=1 Tax=Baekduia sp. TaxID=2600305 RepID=UPI002C7343B2|nr:ABC-F family ATP-binding cassette domain-containing protein [Baekduia sp.]HMJ37230.1 ABC-F family ATP-binding cassette domain-containing protein [Baekduia sp.]